MKLKMVFEVNNDTVWDEVIKALKYNSFEVEYWKGFAPPDRFVIIMDLSTDVGVQNWVNHMKTISDFKWTTEQVSM